MHQYQLYFLFGETMLEGFINSEDASMLLDLFGDVRLFCLYYIEALRMNAVGKPQDFFQRISLLCFNLSSRLHEAVKSNCSR